MVDDDTRGRRVENYFYPNRQKIHFWNVYDFALRYIISSVGINIGILYVNNSKNNLGASPVGKTIAALYLAKSEYRGQNMTD